MIGGAAQPDDQAFALLINAHNTHILHNRVRRQVLSIAHTPPPPSLPYHPEAAEVTGMGYESLHLVPCVRCETNYSNKLFLDATPSDIANALCDSCVEAIEEEKLQLALAQATRRRRNRTIKLSQEEIDHLTQTMSPW